MSLVEITINPASTNQPDSPATFDPDPQEVFVNDSVFWFNADQVETHWPSLVDEPIPPGTSSNPVGFPTAKTVDYICNLHPKESGKIIVNN